jgi:hypothetical protein
LPRPVAWAWRIAPGLLICIVIALASTFVSEHYGGPTLLYALLLGMAFFFLSKSASTSSGIQFGSRTVLRLGVVLLGARTTLARIIELGPAPILIVIGAIISTILFGLAIDYYYGNFDHVDEVLEYAGRKSSAEGDPLANLDFRGGDGKPVLIQRHKDFVAAIIAGYIHFSDPGTYMFKVRSNDGVRIAIGGLTVFEDPRPHPDRNSAPRCR